MVRKSVISLLITVGALACFATTPALAQQPNTFTVYASNLNGPRGLRFGPDGYLYVAKAGTGGTNSTVGSCEQVPRPIGPYTRGKTARISKISSTGTRTTIASGFPSASSSANTFLGVSDVAFMDGTLYALVPGGGCSHGNPRSPSGVARVDLRTGEWHLIANIDLAARRNRKHLPVVRLNRIQAIEYRNHAVEPPPEIQRQARARWCEC